MYSIRLSFFADAQNDKGEQLEPDIADKGEQHYPP